jgi:hypothetical protein
MSSNIFASDLMVWGNWQGEGEEEGRPAGEKATAKTRRLPGTPGHRLAMTCGGEIEGVGPSESGGAGEQAFECRMARLPTPVTHGQAQGLRLADNDHELPSAGERGIQERAAKHRRMAGQ